MSAVLFHVSEQSGIVRFEPRAMETFPDPVVWAIGASHLRNYLLPRDCPRVTYYRVPSSTKADVDRFLGTCEAVVAIEASWVKRVQSSQLYCYRMPSESFECIDPGAGYFVSRQTVEPLGVSAIHDAMNAIRDRGADVCVLDSLWDLHDAVASSSLQFSMIRMRNARQRLNGRGDR